MSVLIVAEQKNGNPSTASLQLAAAGRQLADALGTGLDGIVLGADTLDIAVDTLYAAKHAELASYRPLPYARVLADLIGQKRPEAVLFPDNLRSRDYAPRVAARLDAELLSGVTSVELKDGKLCATKPVFKEKRLYTYAAASALVLLKEGAYVPLAGTPAKVEPFPVALEPADLVQTVEAAAAGSGVDLSSAKVIVALGGGIRKDVERGKQLAEELAGLLGGAVGASRVATDAGWLDHTRQVGQTGQTVAPELYLACGISGQMQHVAGMRNSKVIIAINTDAESPITKLADYVVVGDLFSTLEELIASLKR